MNMFEAYYNIADLIIKIDSTFPIIIENAKDFLCSPSAPDYTFHFTLTDDIPAVIGDATFLSHYYWADQFQRKDGSYLRAFLWKEQFYDSVTVLGDHEGTCYYASEQILMERANDGFELMNYLCIEEILLKFHALVLHSSHLNVNGKGLLFSAPSQTGKSTQAALWGDHEGVTIINGDRSILRNLNGTWYCYGCPMCGTSGIHLQGKEVLSNIILLSQNKDNIFLKVRISEIIAMLYSQITIPTWNEKYVQIVLDALNDLLLKVSILCYSCNMNPDAVTVLNNQIHLL